MYQTHYIYLYCEYVYIYVADVYIYIYMHMHARIRIHVHLNVVGLPRQSINCMSACTYASAATLPLLMPHFRYSCHTAVALFVSASLI